MRKKVIKKLKTVSLFSGCGGLDLGFTGGFSFRHFNLPETKFELKLANDFDADAERVYIANKKYLGNHAFHPGDITKIPAEDIPEFDILLAGFPCQPFSNAGKRQGVHDVNGRGTLFHECERVIKHRLEISKSQSPVAFVFENVRGILSSKMPSGHTVPDEIKLRMSKHGYRITSKLLKASDYGVPQKRYRVIIVGMRNDIPEFDFKILDEIVEEYSLPTEESRPYELYLGSVLCDIPSNASGVKDFWKYSPAGQTMIEMIGKCDDGAEVLRKFKAKIPLDKISSTISKGRSWKVIPPEMMSPRFKKIWDDPERYHSPNFYRRFALGEIAGTITASAQPENCGITHPFKNRRMTIREIARIQSFPDDFEFPYSSISGAYKVIGNAVPPVFGWVIAKALEKHLQNNGII
jgi:DNA (cytosine-5)-methyltransferase 1